MPNAALARHVARPNRQLAGSSVATMSRSSLRGEVRAKWADAGKPSWTSAETLEVAVRVDRRLQQRELNPAARFRAARQANDSFYLRTWIHGCRFPWLRGPRSAKQDPRPRPTQANRRLSTAELRHAQLLLDLIRSRIDELAQKDDRLRFAYNRKVAKELTFDERGKPMHRIRLKSRRRKAQNGMCANGSGGLHALPPKGAVLDRLRAEDGYTFENTRLLCPACDTQFQAAKGYTDSVTHTRTQF